MRHAVFLRESADVVAAISSKVELQFVKAQRRIEREERQLRKDGTG